MAGRGPAPKDPSKRRRRNDAPPLTKLDEDDELRGYALPDDVLPGDEEWHPRTLAWWQTWRESPQAAMFIATDWDFLLDTALLHHTMWTKGRWEFASEVRLRAAKYGATPEDRARLKIQVDGPTAKPAAPVNPAGVTDISSRRARLTG
ncbi:hypothetical protein [Kitasatospora sp. NPDC050543]|uniref:phage terminase small subunit n=1 Tax=Kitasatospora sp. NPDC050543 TaxID=3364054 RepID=UPI0037A1B4BE